jgi:hypothetical protein
MRQRQLRPRSPGPAASGCAPRTRRRRWASGRTARPGWPRPPRRARGPACARSGGCSAPARRRAGRRCRPWSRRGWWSARAAAARCAAARSSCSVTSSVTTEVVGRPSASAPGSTRVSSQRWPSSGAAPRSAPRRARPRAAPAAGVRTRAATPGSTMSRAMPSSPAALAPARRRRRCDGARAPASRGGVEGGDADARGVHQRAHLELRHVALLLGAAVLDHGHVAHWPCSRGKTPSGGHAAAAPPVRQRQHGLPLQRAA